MLNQLILSFKFTSPMHTTTKKTIHEKCIIDICYYSITKVAVYLHLISKQCVQIDYSHVQTQIIS